MTQTTEPSRERLRASLLIGLCCLLVYNANLRPIGAGDTYPARYLPFAVLEHGTVLLDPVARVTAAGASSPYWMVNLPDGHVISLYPVVVPVLVAPLYVPAVGYLHARGWTDRRLEAVAKIMEKLAASLVASLSAALLYLLLRRRASAHVALLLTAAYAFGTTTWMISSQALWQHGMAQLLVIGALLLLTGPCTAPRALAAGLLLGLIAANRPPDVILAAALGAYGLFWAGRRHAALLAAGVAPPVALTLLYNLGVAGHIAGGYGLRGRADFFQHDLVAGVAGLLFSPSRGLFVFSPFLLFLCLAWRHLPRDRAERGLTLAMSIAVVLQILLYARTDWRGGISWGPRFLTDLLPFLIWMLVPVVAALRSIGRLVFTCAVGVAVVIEAIGAFCYTGASDIAVMAVRRGPHKMQAAWQWRNAPFIASLRDGPAPVKVLTLMRGGLQTMRARSARPRSLEESFAQAAARLRQHQQQEGYWLTAHTREASFHAPAAEMNTFLTAHLIDLLDPVAAVGGLEDSLARARRHLTGQIEPGGLVRYHGLPNGPGIGTLGCAITPDTDDTALAWRLAPAPDRTKLNAALETIGRYRTAEGLYRTWLAPREAYQCLDPGRDPNPADLVIQMHLLLLLADVRPDEGRALCEALRPLAADDRIWVYYRKAPLIPLLRTADLRRAGCELALPESRMRTDIPGQQIWVSVARMISEGSSRAAARLVLRELARDDFAHVRTNPPLLYHNDLTASVSRYYWSEDAGYALWMRLYHDYGNTGDPDRGG